MSEVCFSLGKNKFDNKPEQMSCISFSEFKNFVISERSDAKGKTFICSPLALSKHHQNPKKFPGENTWRLKSNVKKRQFLAFDFDDFASREHFIQTLDWMNSFDGFGYTTASHTETSPRARIILSISKALDRDMIIRLSEHLEKQLSQSIGTKNIVVDQSVYRGEQPIYTPLVDAEIFHFEGNVVDIDGNIETQFNSEQVIESTMGELGFFSPPNQIKDGEGREQTILRYAGSLRAEGVPQRVIEKICLDYSANHIIPPLEKAIVLDRTRRYASSNSTHEDWQKPQTLGNTLPPVPALNLKILPNAVREFVEDTSDLMQSPPEFLAVPLMISAAAALGNQWAIVPKRKDHSWTVSPVLWGAIIGRPGTKKSPCLSRAIKPILEIEKQLSDEHMKRLQSFHADKILYEAQLKKAKSQAIQTGAPPSISLPPEEPKPERLIVNDITVQKLTDILQGSPSGALVLQDELVGLLETLDATGQEGARSFYLTAWNGNQSFRVDRIGRGSLVIERLSLCVLGGMQPGKLQRYVEQAVSGGKFDDGLMQRFQLLVWPDIPKEWVDIDRPQDPDAFEKVRNCILALRTLEPDHIGAHTHIFDNIPYLRFSEGGQVIFNAARKAYETQVRSGKLHPAMEAHLSKYPSMIAALSLVIHLIDYQTPYVSAEATEKAVEWSKYLLGHAKRAYNFSSKEISSGTLQLSKRILDKSIPDNFTAREIYRHGWRGLSNPDEVAHCLEQLENCRWIKGVKTNSKTKKTVIYQINPRLFNDANLSVLSGAKQVG